MQGNYKKKYFFYKNVVALIFQKVRGIRLGTGVLHGAILEEQESRSGTSTYAYSFAGQ